MPDNFKTWFESRKVLLQNASKILLFLLIAYFPIFLRLDSFPILIWDESRLALSAMEMNQDNDFLVVKNMGQPDLWSTKPPLMIWCQVICMKIFGVNELAVRLPSALSAFATCLLLMIFCLRYLKNYWIGLISVLVLVTSSGYISMHGTRTGDYDSMLTFFITLYSISFYLYIEHRQKQKYLLVFFLAFTFAVLTKGIAGFIALPALFIFLLIKKQLGPFLKNKFIYIHSAWSILLIAGYYLGREAFNPGYIKAVFYNEIFDRYIVGYDDNKNSFWYYFNNFIDAKFSYWYIFVPCGIIVGIFSKDVLTKKITVFLSIVAAVLFVVISNGKTRLAWYDLPMYPFFAIICAVAIHTVFAIIQSTAVVNNILKRNVLPYLFLFVLFCMPYSKIISLSYNPDKNLDYSFYNLSYYLKNTINDNHGVKYITYEGYNAHHLFYLYILKSSGRELKPRPWLELKTGDVTILNQQDIKDSIYVNYSYKLVGDYYGAWVIEITGEKK